MAIVSEKGEQEREVEDDDVEVKGRKERKGKNRGKISNRADMLDVRCVDVRRPLSSLFAQRGQD